MRTPPCPLYLGSMVTPSTVDGACCGGGKRLEGAACDEILDAADVVRHEAPDLGRLVVGKKPPAVEAGAFRVVAGLKAHRARESARLGLMVWRGRQILNGTVDPRRDGIGGDAGEQVPVVFVGFSAAIEMRMADGERRALAVWP